MRITSKSEMTQKTKEMLKEHGIDLVGVASRDRFNHAPPRHHPRNLMHDFESIVALGVGWKNQAESAGMDRLYWAIKIADAFDLSVRCLQENGYRARIINDGQVSLPRIGEAAGIGEIGLVNFLVTRDFGPRVWLAAIITNAPLVPDSKINHICNKCGKCVDVCPATTEPYRYDPKLCKACSGCVKVCPIGTPQNW